MVRRARARSARLEEGTGNSRSSTPAFSSTLNAMLIGVIIIAAMYFAREVLIPVALAGILSFMLAPLVRLLQKIRLPRAGASRPQPPQQGTVRGRQKAQRRGQVRRNGAAADRSRHERAGSDPRRG